MCLLTVKLKIAVREYSNRVSLVIIPVRFQKYKKVINKMAVIPSCEGNQEVIKCSFDSRLHGNDRKGNNLKIIILGVIVFYTFDGNLV